MKFLTGLFSKPSNCSVDDEIDKLKRRVKLLDSIIKDFCKTPGKYHRGLDTDCTEAIHQLALEKQKLQIQILFLSNL